MNPLPKILLLVTFLSNAIVYGQNMSNTSISTCYSTIYDDGGPSANYSENDYEMTICASSGTELYFVVQNLFLGTAENLSEGLNPTPNVST